MNSALIAAGILVFVWQVSAAPEVDQKIKIDVRVKHECTTAADCEDGQCCKLDYTGIIASKRQINIREPIRRCMDYIPEGARCGGMNFRKCGCVKNTKCTRLPDPTKPLVTKIPSKRALAMKIIPGTYKCVGAN